MNGLQTPEFPSVYNKETQAAFDLQVRQAFLGSDCIPMPSPQIRSMLMSRGVTFHGMADANCCFVRLPDGWRKEHIPGQLPYFYRLIDDSEMVIVEITYHVHRSRVLCNIKLPDPRQCMHPGKMILGAAENFRRKLVRPPSVHNSSTNNRVNLQALMDSDCLPSQLYFFGQMFVDEEQTAKEWAKLKARGLMFIEVVPEDPLFVYIDKLPEGWTKELRSDNIIIRDETRRPILYVVYEAFPSYPFPRKAYMIAY